jgi:hypothetical protein
VRPHGANAHTKGSVPSTAVPFLSYPRFWTVPTWHARAVHTIDLTIRQQESLT